MDAVTRSRGPAANTTLPAILSVILFVGCGTIPGVGGEPDPAPAVESEAPDSGSGVTVISGRQLLDGRGSVLDAIRGKTPSLRVRRGVGPCPRITLRNDASFMTQTAPSVYVDGTRSTDTCILESLRASDVDFVEIYPMGVTTRPGYGMDAHGLILLFMRS